MAVYKPLLFVAAAWWALPLQAADLKDLRIWAGPDSTRVVFDLDDAADHALFTLQGPDRIVIDLQKTELAEQVANQLDGKGIIKRVRTGKREGGGLRVVSSGLFFKPGKIPTKTVGFQRRCPKCPSHKKRFCHR